MRTLHNLDDTTNGSIPRPVYLSPHRHFVPPTRPTLLDPFALALYFGPLLWPFALAFFKIKQKIKRFNYHRRRMRIISKGGRLVWFCRQG
jgi:hypothetical protein